MHSACHVGAVQCLRARRVASAERDARIRAVRARWVRGGNEANASLSGVESAAIIAVQPA